MSAEVKKRRPGESCPCLHIVRTSRLREVRRLLAPGDALLLCEEAVLELDSREWQIPGVELLVLADSLNRRKLAPGAVGPTVGVVDYSGFVTLTMAYERICCW